MVVKINLLLQEFPGLSFRNFRNTVGSVMGVYEKHLDVKSIIREHLHDIRQYGYMLI